MGNSHAIRLATTAIAILLITACASNGGGTTSGYGYGKSTQANKAVADRISGPVSRVDTAIGQVVAGGADRKTLYFFAKDSFGVSNCYDACAAAWPPFMAANASLATDTLTVIDRKDGSQQWGLEGKPVYFWAGDAKSGDTSGDKIPDWQAVRAEDFQP